MKWYTLYNKISDLKFRQLQLADVKAVINGEEVILKVKINDAGIPYLEEDKKGEKK